MEHHHVEHHAAQVVAAIDDLMRRSVVPKDALTVSDVCKHATEPVGNLSTMGEMDRHHVVARVDEVLRIRAGGVY